MLLDYHLKCLCNNQYQQNERNVHKHQWGSPGDQIQTRVEEVQWERPLNDFPKDDVGSNYTEKKPLYIMQYIKEETEEQNLKFWRTIT